VELFSSVPRGQRDAEHRCLHEGLGSWTDRRPGRLPQGRMWETEGGEKTLEEGLQPAQLELWR